MKDSAKGRYGRYLRTSGSDEGSTDYTLIHPPSRRYSPRTNVDAAAAAFNEEYLVVEGEGFPASPTAAAATTTVTTSTLTSKSHQYALRKKKKLAATLRDRTRTVNDERDDPPADYSHDHSWSPASLVHERSTPVEDSTSLHSYTSFYSHDDDEVRPMEWQQFIQAVSSDGAAKVRKEKRKAKQQRAKEYVFEEHTHSNDITNEEEDEELKAISEGPYRNRDHETQEEDAHVDAFFSGQESSRHPEPVVEMQQAAPTVSHIIAQDLPPPAPKDEESPVDRRKKRMNLARERFRKLETAKNKHGRTRFFKKLFPGKGDAHKKTEHDDESREEASTTHSDEVGSERSRSGHDDEDGFAGLDAIVNRNEEDEIKSIHEQVEALENPEDAEYTAALIENSKDKAFEDDERGDHQQHADDDQSDIDHIAAIERILTNQNLDDSMYKDFVASIKREIGQPQVLYPSQYDNGNGNSNTEEAQWGRVADDADQYLNSEPKGSSEGMHETNEGNEEPEEYSHGFGGIEQDQDNDGYADDEAQGGSNDVLIRDISQHEPFQRQYYGCNILSIAQMHQALQNDDDDGVIPENTAMALYREREQLNVITETSNEYEVDESQDEANDIVDRYNEREEDYDFPEEASVEVGIDEYEHPADLLPQVVDARDDEEDNLLQEQESYDTFDTEDGRPPSVIQANNESFQTASVGPDSVVGCADSSVFKRFQDWIFPTIPKKKSSGRSKKETQSHSSPPPRPPPTPVAARKRSFFRRKGPKFPRARSAPVVLSSTDREFASESASAIGATASDGTLAKDSMSYASSFDSYDGSASMNTASVAGRPLRILSTYEEDEDFLDVVETQMCWH